MNTTLIILLIFVPILALILLGLNTLLAPKRSYESKLSSYECGMPVLMTQTRESFQIHFVVVAMLFLVFDLELVLLLPLGVTLSKISTFGFAVAVLFFMILTVGFILELGSNAISISPNHNKNISPFSLFPLGLNNGQGGSGYSNVSNYDLHIRIKHLFYLLNSFIISNLRLILINIFIAALIYVIFVYLNIDNQMLCGAIFSNISFTAVPLVTLNSKKLDPHFITGLTDGEGCFTAVILKKATRLSGYFINLKFSIHMSLRDADLLHSVHQFFNVGIVTISTKTNSVYYEVTGLNNLQIIIDHFLKYPLITTKKNNFLLFVVLFNILKLQEHLTKEGFMRAIAIINNINNPIRPAKLLEIINLNGPMPSLILPPVVLFDKNNLNLSPWWIIGFIIGEGSFTYATKKSTSDKNKQRIAYRLIFAIAQDKRDVHILEAINAYLAYIGFVTTDKLGMSYFKIESLNVIFHFLLPFLNEYPLIAYKRLQYDIWMEIISWQFYDRARDNISLNNKSLKLSKLIEKLSSLHPKKIKNVEV